MRKWRIILVRANIYLPLLVLLLAACHRSHKPQPADSVSEETPAVADTLEPSDADSLAPDTSPSPATGYQLQRDTAEITNLRILARKQRTIYNPALLVGEWLHGSEHEHYLVDGSGSRWDTGDDVDRQEAQAFSWSMDSNLLTMKYTLSLGGLMIRQYVVTFVDDETLVYRDAYGGSYMWDKVPAGFHDLPSGMDDR